MTSVLPRESLRGVIVERAEPPHDIPQPWPGRPGGAPSESAVVMKSHRVGDGERILAVFIDFENLAMGFGGRRDRFDIDKVIARLVEKGKIVAKKAYADWSRFGQYTAALHEAAVELVEIPKRSLTGKNSADIRMCVDAMDLAYSKDHIDTFVVVSGDSDFSPLVSKLKELGKHVIGLGLADSTSNLLRDNCDEFIYYEDLDRMPVFAPMIENPAIPEQKKKAFTLVLDAMLALRRENKELIYSSMVKDTIKRKKPSFNEEYYGYRTFSDLLEDAQRHGMLDLDRHKNSGMYVITRFGSEPRGMMVPPAVKAAVVPPPVRPALPPARPTPPPARPEPPVERESRESREPRDRRRPAGPVGPAAASNPPPPPRVSRPATPPPPPVPDDDDTRLPLGRALIEEVDEIDDLIDEVPSYMPRKSPPVKPEPIKAQPPAKAPPPAKTVKPAIDKPPPSEGRGSRGSNTGTSSRGTGPARGSSKPAGEGRAPRSRGGAAQPRQASAPPPPPPPPPARPKDEDLGDFGAGLDL